MSRRVPRLAAVVAAASVLLAGAAAAEAPRLVGTIAAPGRGAAAVFEDRMGRQALRRVGEAVAPGLRLLAVRRGSAEIADAAGRRTTLRLDARRAGPSDAAGARPAAGRAGEPAPPAALETDRPHMPPEARLVPVSIGGRVEGLRLVGGPPDSRLVRAGLEPGDLIVALDGRPLAGLPSEATAAVALALETAGAEARPLVVEARREEQPLRIEIPADEPAR